MTIERGYMKNYPNNKDHSPSAHAISRRQFLATAGAAAGAGLLVGCGLIGLEGAAGTTAPTFTPIPYTGPRPEVAIARAQTYDRALVRRQVQDLFENIGGVEDIVGRGDKVVMKINLTGGTGFPKPADMSATECFMTHPAVVRAAAELFRDAGAKELYIVEAVWDAASFAAFGYTDLAKDLDVTLIDLNRTFPYSNFASVPVGPDWFIFEKFAFHRILEEADAFVSIAKMKPHCTAGLTLSMKNLVGTVPISAYDPEQKGIRSAFHGTETGHNTRLPRVIVDLNRARPIHLALIDGIISLEGGEGPWNEKFGKVRPGVLAAGRNALATDSVCASLMGYDPASEAPDPPFLQSDNYLNLAYQKGLGTNRLEEIDIVGGVPAGESFPVGACLDW
jgi:uncharacterized protein (DUF362 family)